MELAVESVPVCASEKLSVRGGAGLRWLVVGGGRTLLGRCELFQETHPVQFVPEQGTVPSPVLSGVSWSLAWFQLGSALSQTILVLNRA